MPTDKERKAADHSSLLLALLLSALLLPAGLRVWPFPLLLPIVAYFLVVAAVPNLRATLRSLPIGGRQRVSWWLAVLIAVLTSGVLLGFQAVREPDLHHIHSYLPIERIGWLSIALVFPLANAALEEFVFRNVLFDGVRVLWGTRVAVVASSVLFGLGHFGGYPPGVVGGILAGVFGLSLALLRIQSEGLLVPTVTHVVADATIVGILYRWSESQL